MLAHHQQVQIGHRPLFDLQPPVNSVPIADFYPCQLTARSTLIQLPMRDLKCERGFLGQCVGFALGPIASQAKFIDDGLD